MHNAVLVRRLSIALLFSALTIAGCSNSGNPSYYKPPTNATPTPAGATPSPSPTPTAVGTTPTPTPTPTASGPAATATELFVAAGSSGVAAYNALTGTAVGSPFGAVSGGISVIVGVDDSGNVYEEATTTSGQSFTKYSSAGTLLATYTPTSANPLYLGVAPTGEVVISGYTTNSSTSTTTDQFDEWDPGVVTAAPSRTITTGDDGGDVVFALDAAGDLYAPVFTSAGQTYNVYTADSSTQTGTITDTLASNEDDFYPQAMSVAANGTLFVGEDAFASPDTDQGIYAYTSSGSQYMLTTGNPVIGLDTDSSSTVYAALNNAMTTGNSSAPVYSSDTAQTVEVFTTTSGETESFSDGAPGVLALTVNPTSGAIYLSQFGDGFFENGPKSAGNVLYVAPLAQTVSTLISGVNTGSLSLYDGTTGHNAYNGLVRKKAFYMSVGGGRSAHGAFGRFTRLRHAHSLMVHTQHHLAR